MFVQDREDMLPEEGEPTKMLKDVEQGKDLENTATKMANLSLSSMVGFHLPKTMKVKGSRGVD